jgi:hypothetical protein
MSKQVNGMTKNINAVADKMDRDRQAVSILADLKAIAEDVAVISKKAKDIGDSVAYHGKTVSSQLQKIDQRLYDVLKTANTVVDKLETRHGGGMSILLDAGPGIGARELIISPGCTNERAFNLLQQTARDLVGPERIVDDIVLVTTDKQPNFDISASNASSYTTLKVYGPSRVWVKHSPAAVANAPPMTHYQRWDNRLQWGQIFMAALQILCAFVIGIFIEKSAVH